MSIPMSKCARNIIKAEMSLRNIKTKQICKLLNDRLSITLNEQSFNNKMNRANFAATFFFECMYVLNVKTINFNIDDLKIEGTKDEKKTN